MGPDPITLTLLFFILVLAMLLGIELIRKVPSQLHTPLMSGSNAISGITIVGALIASGHQDNELTATVLAALAVAFAMINVVGGLHHRRQRKLHLRPWLSRCLLRHVADVGEGQGVSAGQAAEAPGGYPLRAE